MTRPIRSASLLCAALAATTVAFAPAPQPSTVTVAPAGDLAAATVVDGRAVTAVRGLTDRSGFSPGEDVRDLTSWVRAHRRIVEASGLATFAATDACAPLSFTETGAAPDCEEPTPNEGGDEEFSYSFVEAAADLDGDGSDDVLEITISFGPDGVTEATTARSGTDGAVLWSAGVRGDDDTFSFLAAAPDIDGDGVDDLVRFAYTFDGDGSGSCTPLRCEFSDNFSETITLTALRGSTGETLGSTQHAFSATFADSFTSLYDERINAGATVFDGSFEIVGGLTGLDFVDLAGPGGSLLVLGTVDVQQSATGVQGGSSALGYDDAALGRTQVEVAGGAELVDLVTGERAVLAQDDAAVLYPTAVTLDGRDALLLDRFPVSSGDTVYGCLYSETAAVFECTDTAGPASSASTRTRIDDALETVWTTPVDPLSLAVYEAGGDLDGDGQDDLLDAVIDIQSFDIVTTAVAGGSGESLWTAPVAGGVVDDGDLLSVAFTADEAFDEDGYEVTIEAIGRRLDGGNGDVLAEADLASIEFFERGDQVQVGFIGVAPASLDGAGLDLATIAEEFLLEEIYREEYCYEEEGDEFCDVYVEYGVVEQRGQLSGHDGATLGSLFVRDVSDTFVSGIVDVDGDGIDDLLIERFTADEESFSLTTTAERTDGSVVWALDDESVFGVLATPTGRSLLTYDLTDGATVVRDAAALSELWRLDGVGVGLVVLVVGEVTATSGD